MRRRSPFRPARLSPLAVRAAQILAPLALRARQVRRLEVDEGDLARLRCLRPERVMILPNHPTNTEPAVLFALSGMVGQRFHYICCREAFDRCGGLWGIFIQRLGAYSLVRGTLDRPSFAATRGLLGSPGVKLVVFPEGEVYSQNDSLLPFQAGVVQLAFWGLEDLSKRGLDDNVHLLPIAIRYRFTHDMRPFIGASIARLETAVGVVSGAGEGFYDRIRRVGETIVGKLERQYDLDPSPVVTHEEERGEILGESSGSPLGERMERLKRALLERAAERVGVRIKAGTLPEQMRSLVNEMHRVTDEPEEGTSRYDRRLWEQQRRHVAPALFELERLANWIAVYDGYVAADPTPERIVHLLRRMEVEVFGRARIGGRQACGIRIGEPICLREHLDAYRADRRSTVLDLTVRVEGEVEGLLGDLVARQRSEPIA
jgi:hypothetical protein